MSFQRIVVKTGNSKHSHVLSSHLRVAIRRLATVHEFRLPTTPIQEEQSANGCQKVMANSLRPYYENQQPVVIREAVASARACQYWSDWNYLQKLVDGDTVCHVEVGGNYAKSERCDIRLGDYFAYLQFFEEKHGRSGPRIPPKEELVYMAQNDVFKEMEGDFVLPDFCLNGTAGLGHLYSTMVWVGPYGCVSPMHFDPLDNVLMQFVGIKHIWMYPPQENLYSGAEGNQKNTSPVNPEEPVDLKQYPLLAEASPAIECVLKPGDLLYIPKKWYHYVRTVETSISVNAWWR